MKLQELASLMNISKKELIEQLKRDDVIELKLTERETEIIIFLNNSKESQSIENLQNKTDDVTTDIKTINKLN